jgi:hypothetical protein
MRQLFVSLVVSALASIGTAGAVAQEPFVLQVGPPVAAMPSATAPGRIETKVGKNVVFVLRTTGCPDPSSVRYAGTAEAVVNGARRSWPLPIGAVSPAGVVGVVKNWMERAPWVAVISASCGDRDAGALVRIVNDTYHRDAVELLPKRPQPVDVERAMVLLGGQPTARTVR